MGIDTHNNRYDERSKGRSHKQVSRFVGHGVREVLHGSATASCHLLSLRCVSARMSQVRTELRLSCGAWKSQLTHRSCSTC